MANNPCGCPGNSNDPNAPETPPEGTSHSHGSINCPSPDVPCYSNVCDEKFRTLPRVKRLELLGVSGKCLARIDTSQPGLLSVDPKGGVVVSNAPNIDLQQLVKYASNASGLILDKERNPIESTPPEFPYLIVQLEDGQWRKVRGRPGSIGLLMWDDDGFHVKDVDESNILISRPDESAEQIELIGFNTSDCLQEGERNNLTRLTSDIEGVIYFNPVTNKVTITSVCELFDDIGNLTGVPYLLACSDGSPIRFKGTSDSILIWNSTTGGFELIEIDEKACDPTCGCSTELFLTYNCVTGQFDITEPDSHVLSWRSNSDAGANVSLDFTLPWPAMVTMYAGRRFVPVAGSLDVTRADIIVDGIPATSPSDGGLVARLDNATTNTGVAIVSLKKGSHNAYLGNTVTTNDTIPNWSGAWIKIVAHKIKECDPLRSVVGGGTIRTAYGGSGEECDCPPGPDGATGATGPQGPQGIQGPAGSGIVLGECSGVGEVEQATAAGVVTIGINYRDFGVELDEDDEPAWFCRASGGETVNILAQAPIPGFTTQFLYNAEIVKDGDTCQFIKTFVNLVFDGQQFSITEGDITTSSVPCCCSE